MIDRCQGTVSAWTQKSIRLSKTGFSACNEPRSQEGASRFEYRELIGGADRDRTDDLRLAKPALSQLSYSPGETSGWWAWVDLNYRPPAYQADALTGLSYRPEQGSLRAMRDRRPSEIAGSRANTRRSPKNE